MSEPSADSAALRRAFNRATETYPRHLAAFLSKEGEAAFRVWWGQLYEAVRDTTAGLELLAELQRQKEWNLRFAERIYKQSELLSRKAEAK